ncbi:MAG: hypothetical protein J6C00_03630 [Eubacterium sp.]|nr:hypothetical protein [Eubacterium sp.]
MTKEKLFAVIALAALAVAFLSGILVAVFPEVMVWTLLHKLSAVVLVLGTIVHVWQHSRMRG